MYCTVQYCTCTAYLAYRIHILHLVLIGVTSSSPGQMGKGGKTYQYSQGEEGKNARTVVLVLRTWLRLLCCTYMYIHSVEYHHPLMALDVGGQ